MIYFPVRAEAPVVPLHILCGRYVCKILDTRDWLVCQVKATKTETSEELFNRAKEVAETINKGA